MGKMNPARNGKSCARCGRKTGALKLVRFVALCGSCAELAAAYTASAAV